MSTMTLQDSYGEETHSNGGSDGRLGAALEEILYLIARVGYAGVYPEVFCEEPNKDAANAMDIAGGGHFRQVPRSNPEGARFIYDDKTCDYGCHITEYAYWALTSILDAQRFCGRAEEIADEWRLHTPKLVRKQDSRNHESLTRRDYSLPTRLPHGKYQKRFESRDSD